MGAPGPRLDRSQEWADKRADSGAHDWRDRWVRDDVDRRINERSLEDAAGETGDGEFGRVGDGHDGHDTRLHRIADHQVACIGHAPGHV